MGLVENLKNLADLTQKAGQLELYRQLVAAEGEARELARANRRLEDRVEELERTLRFKEEIVFKAPLYYLKEGDQTPYCARCWEEDRHAIHVTRGSVDQGEVYWNCPACQRGYLTGRRSISPDDFRMDPHSPWT